MNAIDLHVHSTSSDGTLAPSELVLLAKKKNLSAFALTDHDTVDGIAEAISAAEALRKETGSAPEVIPGIELSTEYQGADIHIVGLFVPYDSPLFLERLAAFQDSRDLRNRKMCDLLTAAGYTLTYEELQAECPDAVITRAHFAALLMKKGYVKSRNEAFDRFIGDHCPYYIPREKITPAEAVHFLKENGALAILAHPVLYGMSKTRLTELITLLKAEGLDGIEAVYSTYTPSDERDIRTLAKQFDLILSGGSDYHGGNKPDIDLGTGRGHLFVPEEFLTDIRAKRSRLIFSDLDGTLFQSDHRPSQRSIAAINRLAADGHCFVLCSGRPLPNLIDIWHTLGLSPKGQYIIGFNGSVVYDCEAKRPIWESKVPLSIVKELFVHAAKAGLHIHTYENDEVISAVDDPETDYYLGPVPLRKKILPDFAHYEMPDPYKALVIGLDRHEKLVAFKEKMDAIYGDRLNSFFSSPRYLEFVPKGAGKGYAAEYLAGHLGIAHANTIAFGDEMNDLTLLQAVENGYCMCNGNPLLKEQIPLHTEQDCNHDGVIRELAKLGLLPYSLVDGEQNQTI